MASISINEVHFKIFPHIIQKESNFYLVYQIDTTFEMVKFKLVVSTKVVNDTAFYYFVGRTSFKENGNIKSILIVEKNSFNSLVKQNSIFWLNPNGENVRLEEKVL